MFVVLSAGLVLSIMVTIGLGVMTFAFGQGSMLGKFIFSVVTMLVLFQQVGSRMQQRQALRDAKKAAEEEPTEWTEHTL